ncbi:MAG: O-antigen ligase family protein [Nonlabens sp.]
MPKIENLPYPIVILIHIILGAAIVTVPFLAKILVLVVMGYLLLRILNNSDRNNEVLLACIYFVCVEVFFKMTKAMPLYEMGKYFVLICVVLGILLKGFSLKSSFYVIYILTYIPAIFVAAENIAIDESLRKSIAFNLAGPVILGVVAIYCYNRKISREKLLNLFGLGAAALAMMAVYVVFSAPSVEEIDFNAASNATASGGYGPNQVSTAFGIGIFLTFARFILIKKLSHNLIDLSLFLIFTYRGYLTFSRGGVLTAFVMIAAFIFTITILYRSGFRKSFIPKFILIGAGVVLAFAYTSVVTGGMVDNRYANKNSLGEEKEDLTTGRGELASLEIQAFLENPVLGIGAGMSKYYRLRKAGIGGASHNELTRTLSEHGSIGVLSIAMLVFIPLFYRLGDRSNIFFYSFLIFWFATINHSAMRIAAPSFIYGLALLRFLPPDKKSLKDEEGKDEFVELIKERKLLSPRRLKT